MLSVVEAFAPPAYAAFTKVYSAPMDVQDHGAEGARLSSYSRGLFELDRVKDGFVSSGTFTLPAVQTPAFDSLVASWNADAPAGTSVDVQGRIHRFGSWSEWFSFGRWSRDGSTSAAKESDQEIMDIDTLRLRAGDVKADAAQLRAVLYTNKAGTSPVVSLLALTVADHTTPLVPEPAWAPGPWVRDLAVPERSQMTEQAKFARDICSPTSLSMAMAFWERPFPVADAAAAVQDRRLKKYGDWPFNTAWAARAGLRAWVSYLNRVTDLQEEIAAGVPVVVSISFEGGELDGSPLKRTRGHLLVVRGFTAGGDVIVNDPAAPDASTARRVYGRAQFRKAWLENKRGLVYLLRPRWPADLAIGVPDADLWGAPQPGAGGAMDRNRLTQLISGESVRILEAPGDRVRAVALEQAHSSSGAWSGYGGWLDPAALATPSSAMKPNAVVASTTTAAFWQTVDGRFSRDLPMGARVMRLSRTGAPLAGEGPGLEAVRLFDGTQASVAKAALEPVPGTDDKSRRAALLAAARRLLGRPYVWGGRSAAGAGVDCSGLVSLAYRVAGVDAPRDAQDLFLKAVQQDRPGKPGDLMFLSKPGHPELVNHVALVDGETLIESVEDAGVREITFAKRLGKARSKARSGSLLNGRTVYFGTIIP